MQLPTVVDKACFAYVLAANVGSAGYPLLAAANANLLLAHGSPAQVDAFARPELVGRFARWVRFHPLSREQLREILAAAPANVDALFLLGQVYRAAGFEARASTTFRKVLELKPRHAGALEEMRTSRSRPA